MIDSNADTLRDGIRNPCDRDGCPFAATHRIARVFSSGDELDVCDEHCVEELRAGAVHLIWFDNPLPRSA